MRTDFTEAVLILVVFMAIVPCSGKPDLLDAIKARVANVPLECVMTDE